MNLVGSRFQFSLRTLLLLTAAIALLLVPVAWVTRERMQMMRAQRAVLQAREVALRSVIREGQRLPRQSQTLEQLRRENADLKQQVEHLRREVEQLKSSARRTDTVGQ
jgi:predicted RNase H-like nuclease (RuvC/YqgF family)